MDLKKLEEVLQNVDLNGFNCELENTVSFMSLTKRFSGNKMNIPYMSYISFIEKFYLQLCNHYSQIEVKPMEVSEGSVVIPDGKLYHRSRIDMEKLGQISVGGILASEWFGVFEAEEEGRFCSFAQEYLSPETVKKIRCIGYTDYFNIISARPEIAMFFLDETHPITQQLMRLDYFHYEYIKRTNPSKLPKIYAQEEIDMFDKLIEPISPGGVTMIGEPREGHNYWHAFVGGIPPQIINGICISSKNLNFIDNLSLISEMFPSAIIFDENKQVLVYPKNYEDNIDMKSR